MNTSKNGIEEIINDKFELNAEQVYLLMEEVIAPLISVMRFLLNEQTLADEAALMK